MFRFDIAHTLSPSGRRKHQIPRLGEETMIPSAFCPVQYENQIAHVVCSLDFTAFTETPIYVVLKEGENQGLGYMRRRTIHPNRQPHTFRFQSWSRLAFGHETS